MAMDYLHEKSEAHGKAIEEKLAAEDASGTERLKKGAAVEMHSIHLR